MSSIRNVTTVVGLLTLVGCASGPSPEELVETSGQAPMSAEEIQSALVGNTIYLTGATRGNPWEWAAIHKADGTAVGKAWWTGGSEVSEARWEISEEGLFCERWNNDEWAGGGRNCYEIYRNGDDELVFITRKGPDDNDVLTLKEGNPHNL